MKERNAAQFIRDFQEFLDGRNESLNDLKNLKELTEEEIFFLERENFNVEFLHKCTDTNCHNGYSFTAFGEPMGRCPFCN